MNSATRFAIAAALLAAPLAAMPAAAFAQPAQSQFTGLKLSGDRPIQIESDKLEVHQNEHTAVFTGNVTVVQGDTLMKAGTMTVHYSQDEKSGTASDSASALPSGSSNIERIEAEGKVYVKSEDQVATGDRGSFDMKTEVLVLSGDQVVLTQGENVVVGCKLTVYTRSGEAKLDGCGRKGESGGRVKMLLKPESKQNQNR